MSDSTPVKGHRPGGRAFLLIAFLLDLLAIAAWVFGFFGRFPPHPWIFMVCATIAVVAGIGGMFSAFIAFRRGGVRWQATLAVVVGIAPIAIVVIYYFVSLGQLTSG